MKKALIIPVLAAAMLAVTGVDAPAQLPNTERKPLPPVPVAAEAVAPVSPCPSIELQAPQKTVRDGEHVGFTAMLSGGDAKVAPLFNWSISAGTVVSGQGTSRIGVDSTGAGADKAITATVQIGGFPPECAADATVTLYIAGPARKADEFGTLAENDENARLDAFISMLTEKDLAYVFAYAGRTSPRGQAANDVRRIRARLLTAGAPKERIVTIDGGFREDIAYELWVVPLGAETPHSTPTIKAKDIVYPKPTPAAPKRP